MAMIVTQWTRTMGRGGAVEIPRHNTAHEVVRLRVDPAVWTRVTKYWAETNEGNKGDPLEGYGLGALRRHDLKTLKEGGARGGARRWHYQ